MHLAIITGIILLALLCPWSGGLPLALVVVSVIAGFARGNWSGKQYLWFLMLLSFPFSLYFFQQFKAAPSFSLPDTESLKQELEVSFYLDEQLRQNLVEVFDRQDARFNSQDLLEQVSLPTYTALTVLNLNLEPIVWKGRYFSDQYGNLVENIPEFTVKDGRLFLRKLSSLPSPEKARGFLVAEILLLSQHAREEGQSWFCHQLAHCDSFEPVVVDPNLSDFLEELALGIGVEPPPFEFRLLPRPPKSKFLDLFALLWSFTLLACIFSLQRNLSSVHCGLFFALYGLILWLPFPMRLDFMTTFGSYIFGNRFAGNLLASPFHFFLTIGVIFLWVKRFLAPRLLRGPYAATLMYFPLLALFIFLPGFLQNYNTFSFIHPLQAFYSPGSFLSHLAFLMTFGFLIAIFDETGSPGLVVVLGVAAAAGLFLLWWRPEGLSAAIAFSLIWLLKKYKPPPALKAGLAVLAFYPGMVLEEQKQEILRVRNELLDEITLMGERNYFRMGRIIQRLPEFVGKISHRPHANITEMFAKQCGLFEDEIDFALRLTDPEDQLVSEIDQHISLDRIPYVLGPTDRILTYEEGQGGGDWMIYRTTLWADSRPYSLVVVLGNDFHNLSLARNLRSLESDESTHGKINPFYSKAYLLDVFSSEGNPLYGQSSHPPLTQAERKRLAETPQFWEVQGRNTVFFFRDHAYIFRITHKATPLKMISVRYLAMFLVLLALLNGIRLSLRPGRGFLARWRRSFIKKWAGFMFLSSVLPTATLGFFLISSIQRNQEREEADLMRHKILATKNFLRDTYLGSPDRVAVPFQGIPTAAEETETAGPRGAPRDIPIPKFSRMLGEDLSLYVNGSLKNTNQPEVFRQGLMNRRLPYRLAKALILDKKPFVLERKPLVNGRFLLVAYSPIALMGNRAGVLAMTMIPFSQRQEKRWQEQLEFSLTLLFGLLFGMTLLTRFFSLSYLRPVAAITRSATRMAKGLRNHPIKIHRQDELDRMVQAFNTMRAQILQSQGQLQSQLGKLDETLRSMSSGLLGFNELGEIILQNNKAWELLLIKVPPINLDQLIGINPNLIPIKEFFVLDSHGELSIKIPSIKESREILIKVRTPSQPKDHGIRCILMIEDITHALTANRFKAWSEMARRVAHEIKNPLTPIQLEMDYLTKLYKDDHPQFGEALEEAAEQIRAQVDHLRRIATEFSDYARPVEVEFGRFDVVSLMEAILKPYAKTLPKMDIHVSGEGPMMVFSDPRLLRRALHNLIINAIHALEENGRLKVIFREEAHEGKIWIEDNGPGIPADEQEKVFEAYFSTKDQGTGLGLLISRRYINLVGGTLGIDPDFSGGTRFMIVLPIRP